MHGMVVVVVVYTGMAFGKLDVLGSTLTSTFAATALVLRLQYVCNTALYYCDFVTSYQMPRSHEPGDDVRCIAAIEGFCFFCIS